MELTEAEFTTLAGELLTIRDGFVETDEQPVCDTFYIVSTYNKVHTDSPINGDTCEYVLSNVEVVETPIEEV